MWAPCLDSETGLGQAQGDSDFGNTLPVTLKSCHVWESHSVFTVMVKIPEAQGEKQGSIGGESRKRKWKKGLGRGHSPSVFPLPCTLHTVSRFRPPGILRSGSVPPYFIQEEQDLGRESDRRQSRHSDPRTLVPSSLLPVPTPAKCLHSLGMRV